MLFTNWQSKDKMLQIKLGLLKSRYTSGFLLISLAATTVVTRGSDLARVMPGCPIRAVTGLDCPSCGSVRCIDALMKGQLGTALDQNMLVSGLVAGGLTFLVIWLIRGSVVWEKFNTQKSLKLMTVVTLVFWVSRLAPWEVGEWLSSGTYHQ